MTLALPRGVADRALCRPSLLLFGPFLYALRYSASARSREAVREDNIAELEIRGAVFSAASVSLWPRSPFGIGNEARGAAPLLHICARRNEWRQRVAPMAEMSPSSGKENANIKLCRNA